MEIPSLPTFKVGTSLPTFKLGRRRGPAVVGLDIQPGLVAAVQASVNGSILVDRASTLPLAADLMRDGEVADIEALAGAVRELFNGSGLGKRVRIGVANQRTVMRTVELPPITDAKELAQVVRFQAEDQIPMPLANAVLDFHPLGIVDTPAGPRQRAVLVAAQRDMIERLLAAVRQAGLRPDGVDLSAFALIRSLYRHGDEEPGARVLYLNVDGLTNLAIAEGSTCRFTRVVGGGLEAMAVELAERRGIMLTEARALLAAVDLAAAAVVEHGVPAFETADSVAAPAPDPVPAPDSVPAAYVAPPSDLAPAGAEDDDSSEQRASVDAVELDPGPEVEDDASQLPLQAHDTPEPRDDGTLNYSESASVAAAPVPAPSFDDTPVDEDVRMVLEGGIREIAGEVRNSLEFHRMQEDGGQVSHVALSGAVVDIPGFADALQLALGVEVQVETIGVTRPSLADEVPVSRLAVAAGLATLEAPR